MLKYVTVKTIYAPMETVVHPDLVRLGVRRGRWCNKHKRWELCQVPEGNLVELQQTYKVELMEMKNA